jgi:hypothetical protein
MSDFTTIRAVTKTLEAVLKDSITNNPDPQLNGVKVDLRSPKEMRENKANGVSLWLYRVMRDGDMLNHPARRIAPNQLAHQSLPLHLHYLITPVTVDPLDRHLLLGRVLQVFNDHAILRGSDFQDTLKGSAEELRLTLETLSLDELSGIWDSMDEPYEVSITYAVQVVQIDSELEPVQTAPVVSKQTTYTQILSSS